MTTTDDLDLDLSGLSGLIDAERIARYRERRFGPPVDGIPWGGGGVWARYLIEDLRSDGDLDCEAVGCWCLEPVGKDPDVGYYDGAARHGEHFPGPPRFDRPLAEQPLPYPPVGLPRWAR